MAELHSQPRGGEDMRRIGAAAAVVLAIVWSAAPAVAQDPRAPEVGGSIPAQTIAAGQSASLDLTPYFSDPDGDALAYAATVSDVAIATVSVSGNILTIAGVEPGMAVVTVFASDPGGLSATQRTEVTVEAPNRGTGACWDDPRTKPYPGPMGIHQPVFLFSRSRGWHFELFGIDVQRGRSQCRRLGRRRDHHTSGYGHRRS